MFNRGRVLVWPVAVLLALALFGQEPPAKRVRQAVEAWTSASGDAAKKALVDGFSPVDTTFIEAVYDQGDELVKKGDFTLALDAYHFGVALSSRLDKPAHISVGWQLIGSAERRQGRYPESERDYLRALEAARRPGAERRIPLVLNNLAGVYVSQSMYAEGLEILNQTVDWNRRTGIIDDPAPYQNIAIVQAMRGDNARAMASFLKALEIYERKKDTLKIALTHSNIGILQVKQGNYEAAAREYELATGIMREGGDKAQLASTLGDFGRVRDAQGRTAEALEYITQALNLSREFGLRPSYNEALLNLANFHLRHNDLKQAAVAFAEARDTSEKELHDSNTLGNALRGLGFTALRSGDAAKAAEYAALAILTARRIGEPNGEWQATALAGLAARAQGNIPEARRNLTAAIALIERQRGTVAGGDVEKQRYFEEAVYPYRELASLEVKADDPAAALAAAERARARVLLDVLAGGPEQIDRVMTDDERARERRLRADIAVINSRLAKAPVAQVATLTKERDEATRSHEAFLQTLFAAHPELRQWRGESPAAGPADMARLVAEPGAAIVEYLSGRDELLLFVVTAGSEAAHPKISVYRIPVTRAELARRTDRYRAMLEGRDPAFRAESRALHKLLLAPAAAELRGKTRVRIVPDGPLWELPFQSLTDPTGAFWIETATLSRAPSITFLRDQAAKRNSTVPLSRELAVLGDPARPDNPPVPALRDQARRIAALYSAAGPQILLTGGDANERAFKQEAPSARIVHVAAHGQVDPVNGLHSRVLLAPTASAADSPEDGWLEAWELMRMRLSADLVVLSACETGRGRSGDGEGLLGLTWALFVSGAQSAVVSQWRVESESTTELMVDLHRGLRKGLPGDAALRASVLALMKKPAWRHPMYWAPFIYSGR